MIPLPHLNRLFATLQQLDKDRSDIQRIGKLEQEKSAPPLGV